MAWVWAVWTHLNTTVLTSLLGVILFVDLIIWASTKRLLKARADKPDGFVDAVMRLIGSWPSLTLMAIVSVAWAWWDFTYGRPEGPLDLSISIWTMLMDVLVIISANYTRLHDRKLLLEIRDELLSQRKDRA